MFTSIAVAAAGLMSNPAPDYAPMYHNAERAFAMLETLSSDEFQGRQWGTPENEAARIKIGQRFAALGLKPVTPRYQMPFSKRILRGDREFTVTGTNLVGMIEGETTGGPALVVTAHFDHVGVRAGKIYNGADDNASGVSALLEVAAYFSKNQPAHDVIFVAFDAEETGLVGARVFVENPPIENSRIGMNLNLDMVSRADNGKLWAIGTYHFPFLKEHVRAVAAEAPLSLNMGFDEPTGNPRDDWTFLSDQGPFIAAGIPAIYLGVEDHADYHQPTDDAALVDPETFAKSVDTIILMAKMIDADMGAIARQRKAVE